LLEGCGGMAPDRMAPDRMASRSLLLVKALQRESPSTPPSKSQESSALL